MAQKDRSYIPPTETEYDPSTEQSYVIVWSLGNKVHPWKNLYLKDYSDEESNVIDVYQSLKLIASIPFDERESGTILTVDDTLSKKLIWKSLDTLAKDENYGIKASTIISDILKSTPVNCAKCDEEGESIKDKYLKQANFKDSNIVDELTRINYPIPRTETAKAINVVPYAEADQHGKIIDEEYLNYTNADTRYCPIENKTPRLKSEAYDFSSELTVAFTNDFNSLFNTPTIPSYEGLVETAIDGAYAKVQAKLTGTAENISTHGGILDTRLYNAETNLALLTDTVGTINANYVAKTDYANKVIDGVSKPGILKVKDGNGLELVTDEIDEINKVASVKMKIAKSASLDKTGKTIPGEPGSMYINKGNGLGYKDATGEVYFNKATTSTVGGVRIGSPILIDSKTGSISLSLGDTLKTDTNKTIDVKTASYNSLGVVKADDDTITLTDGKLSLDKDNVINALGYTPAKFGHFPGEVFAAIGVTDAFTIEGCVECNGDKYYKKMFPDFWTNYIESGKLITCGQSAYDEEKKDNKGQCSKWCKDEDSEGEYFRVPTIPNGSFIQQGDSGTCKLAGLPNITGRLRNLQGSKRYDTEVCTKAFKEVYSVGDDNGYEAGSTTYGIDFDASRSDPIYGKSTTVQPQSVCVKYFVCIATGSVPGSSVDWDEWKSAMNNKMDKNSWCTTPSSGSSTASLEKPAVIVTNVKNGSSWYRIWSDGWIEQGGLVSSNLNSIHSFNKSFKDTNYSLAFSMNGSSTGPDSYCFYCWPYDASNFKIYTTGFGCNKVWWYACGY